MLQGGGPGRAQQALPRLVGGQSAVPGALPLPGRATAGFQGNNTPDSSMDALNKVRELRTL